MVGKQFPFLEVGKSAAHLVGHLLHRLSEITCVCVLSSDTAEQPPLYSPREAAQLNVFEHCSNHVDVVSYREQVE